MSEKLRDKVEKEEMRGLVPGTLYLCATPIGNLEDMTYRAVRVLGEVNLVAAEDTRHTRKLLSHFNIHTPLISYHEHNKLQRGPEIVSRLLMGENVAIVSDAGMPGISDPGMELVRLAIDENITVVPLPGANAALSGLIASGLDTVRFTFIGFMPKTNKKRRELLSRLVDHPYTLIFYESPHHLKSTLSELAEFFGERSAVAARELTKRFEEFLRGTLTELNTYFCSHSPRGEFCLLVAGKGEEGEGNRPVQTLSLEEAVGLRMADGIEKKEAIRQIAQERGVPKREVYQAMLARESQA
jgi:16S rRNA (cytidine1402-2'-O)-methyltransferase